jgi:hypothetical protein
MNAVPTKLLLIVGFAKPRLIRGANKHGAYGVRGGAAVGMERFYAGRLEGPPARRSTVPTSWFPTRRKKRNGWGAEIQS